MALRCRSVAAVYSTISGHRLTSASCPLFTRRFDDSLAEFEVALRLNPNFSLYPRKRTLVESLRCPLCAISGSRQLGGFEIDYAIWDFGPKNQSRRGRTRICGEPIKTAQCHHETLRGGRSGSCALIEYPAQKMCAKSKHQHKQGRPSGRSCLVPVAKAQIVGFQAAGTQR
jgi:hypothetical protein